MALQHIPLQDITINDIRALIDEAETEDRFIDYKAELYAKKEDDDRELRYDVTAFANALGGDILCGVPEKVKDGRNTGIPDAARGLPELDTDSVILRYHQVLNGRIEPRVPGVEMRAVPGGELGPVLVIRVPRSWAMPHVVRNNDWFRCYIRRGNSKGDPIDVHQLRDAFLLSSTTRERMRAFRAERIQLIGVGQTSIQIKSAVKIIIHVVSLGAFEGGSSLKWPNEILNSLIAPNFSGRFDGIRTQRHARFNFDGYLLYNDEINPLGRTNNWERYSYVQVYREGMLEMVDSLDPDEKMLPARLGYHIARYLSEVLGKMSGMGFGVPAFVMISLLGMNGRVLCMNGNPPQQTPAIVGRYQPFDRDVLSLPEVLVDDFKADIKLALRDALDALWQAGGWSGHFEQ